MSREYHRKYRAKNRERIAARRRRPDVKAKAAKAHRAYSQRPEIKAKRREQYRAANKKQCACGADITGQRRQFRCSACAVVANRARAKKWKADNIEAARKISRDSARRNAHKKKPPSRAQKDAWNARVCNRRKQERAALRILRELGIDLTQGVAT